MTNSTVWANWNAPSNIKALTTTRIGGVSKPPFGTLNLGTHVSDNDQNVQQNRALIKQQLNLPNDPVWLEQVHGTDIIELSNSIKDIPSTDGAFTANKGCVCAIMTADCMPIFLSNVQGTKAACLHAGWRGLADGIIEKGVNLFNQSNEEIIAYAGPTISKQHFEVGAEVKVQLGGSSSAYRASERTGHYYADLYQLAGQRLADIGVMQYTHSSYCTYADDELFYSYRRENETGRMVSLIWME